MKEPAKNFFIGIFTFSFDILLFFLFWKNNILLTALLLILSFVLLAFLTSREEKIFYFTGFFLGPVYDLLLVPAGVWSYGNPTILNVPLWLAPAYGISIVAIYKIGKAASKFFE